MKKLGLIPTAAMIGSMMLAGCSEPQQQTTIVGSPTPTLEQRVTETQQPLQQAPDPTPTFAFNPTPFPYDEKSEMPLDSRLAFVAQDQDYVDDIWVLDGSTLRRLTEDFNYEHNLSWSADGKNIAYTSRNYDKHISVLRIINVETGDERDIYSDGSFGLYSASWSTDNGLIAFSQKPEKCDGADYHSDKCIFTLNTINPETLEKNSIAEVHDPINKIAWIDESRILFTTFGRNHSLYYADLTGESYKVSESAALEVSQNKANKILSVGVSNNEIKLFEINDDMSLSEINVPIGYYNKIMNNGNIITGISLGEDGFQLLRLSNDGDSTVTRELLNLEMIQELGSYSYLEPYVLSIDNNQLLIGSGPYGDITHFLYSLDGRHLRELDFGQEYPFFSNMHSFAWSPIREDLMLKRDEDIEIINDYEFVQTESLDANLLFIASDKNQRNDIWKLEGNNLENLTNDSAHESEILLMPSETEILYIVRERIDGESWDDAQSVGYVMGLDGENRSELFRLDEDGNELSDFQISPDGKYIAAIEGISYRKDKLALFNIETGQKKCVLGEDYLGRIGSFDWSPDGEDIIVASEEGLLRYNAESLESERFYIHSSVGGSTVQYSPDGKHFVVSIHDGVVNRLYLGDESESRDANLRLIEGNNPSPDFIWTPDSQSVVYSTYTERKRDENNEMDINDKLTVFNINTGEKRVIHENIFENLGPDDQSFSLYSEKNISPDGNTIIFSGSRRDLYAIDIDGTNFKTIPYSDEIYFFGSVFPNHEEDSQSVFIP